MSASRTPAAPGGPALDTTSTEALGAAGQAADAPRTPDSPGGWDDAPWDLGTGSAQGKGRGGATAASRYAGVAAPPAAVAAPTPSGDGRAGSAPARRGPADPVRALMHRHRELCERAVDPLEIAAGLEAHGVTDRTAARFRHRDVFALAEELYARVPRVGESGNAGHTGGPAGEPPAYKSSVRLVRPARTAYALLPGAACALTAAGLELTAGEARAAVAAAGVVVVAVALAVCLRHGPLRVEGRTSPTARLAVAWLLAYAVFGDVLLGRLVQGGPQAPWAAVTAAATAVALAAALAPATWCAHLFAVRGRRKLATSRGTEEFAGALRPLLAGVTGLFVAVLLCLRLAAGGVVGGGAGAALAGGVALGALLFIARLLAVHGFPEPARAGLLAATALQVGALGVLLVARLPGCGFLAGPVEALVAVLVEAGGAGAVTCAVAALGLFVHATAALSRSSAHGARPGCQ
ncbi:hypothetical protein [Streptomyces hypolithicus]